MHIKCFLALWGSKVLLKGMVFSWAGALVSHAGGLCILQSCRRQDNLPFVLCVHRTPGATPQVRFPLWWGSRVRSDVFLVIPTKVSLLRCLGYWLTLHIGWVSHWAAKMENVTQIPLHTGKHNLCSGVLEIFSLFILCVCWCFYIEALLSSFTISFF